MDNFSMFSYSASKKSQLLDVQSLKGKGTEISKNQSLMAEEPQNIEKSIKLEKPKKIKSKVCVSDPISIFNEIRKWRENHPAPVDTIGCNKLSEQDKPKQIQKYQILISLILSVQTKDQTTSKTVKALQDYGLTPEKMAQISEPELVSIIYQCNFNKRKAKNIIQVSKIVLTKGLPKDKQQLLALPGIGTKISMIYLRQAEGVQEGIGVDTHVHRISNLLGWVCTKNPNETEEHLQKVFPKKYWKDVNITLVGFGQIHCTAKKPLCISCPVSKLCPSSSIRNSDLNW